MNKNCEAITEQWFGVPIYQTLNSNIISNNALETCLNLCDFKNEEIQDSGCCRFSSNSSVLDNISEFKNIKIFIELQLKNFVDEIYGIKQEVYITDSFVTAKFKNEGHQIHSHDNSFISGIYYINCNDNDTLEFYHKPAIFKEMNLSFDLLHNNIFNSSSVCYKIKKGSLFIFPSFLNHGVKKNLSDIPRVCISFNTFFRGKFGTNNRLKNLIIK